MVVRSDFAGQQGGTFSFVWDPPIGQLAIGMEKWADLIDDFSDFYTRVVEVVRRHMGKQFDTEGSYTGGQWAALSDSYAAWKEDNFPGRPILVLTGALRAAAVDGGPGSLLNISPRLLEVGIDGAAIPYARTHQAGEGNVPQREILVVTKKFEFVLTQLFQAFVVWARKSALGVDDPFLDERFESRIEAIAARSSGDESALDVVFRAGLTALGIR